MRLSRNIDVWSGHDQTGEWVLYVGKKRGKLSLDEIREAAESYETDFYVLVLDCTEKDAPYSDTVSVPNDDGTTTEYTDIVRLYPAGNVWNEKGE